MNEEGKEGRNEGLNK